MKSSIMRKIICFVLLCGCAAMAQGQNDSTRVENLKDVSITKRMNVVSTVGSCTTIRIAGTHYAKIGNVANMLVNLPGVIRTASGIEVSGYGKPIFFVNGREVIDDAEFSLLKSADIKSVKIDRQPGIENLSDARCVVYIETIKRFGDFSYLSADTYAAFLKKSSVMPSLYLKMQTGKFATSLSYMFASSGSRINECYFRQIVHDNYIFDLHQPRELNSRMFSNIVRWIGEYSFDDWSKLGLYYIFKHYNNRERETGSSIYSGYNDAATRSLSQLSKARSNVHSVTAMYQYKKGANSFSLSQDFAMTARNSSVVSDETNPTSRIHSDNDYDYIITTTTLRYRRQLPWNISLSIAAKYNFVSSDNDNGSYDEYSQTKLIGFGKSTEHSQITSAYLARKFGSKWGINAGVQYEYINRHFKNEILQDAIIKQHYFSVYPYVKVTYKNPCGFSAYTQFQRYATHPNFRQINSGATYLDAYSYSIGNPEITSSFDNVIAIGASYNGLDFSARYSFETNPIEDVEVPINLESDVVYAYSMNFWRASKLNFSLGYSQSFNKFDLHLSGRMTIPHSKTQVMGEIIERNRISFNASANLAYTISPCFSVYSSYDLQGHRQYLTLEQNSVQSWSIGVNGSFLKDKLNINIEVSDILNKQHYNNLSYMYDNVTNGTYGHNDFRGVSINISYTIFNKSISLSTTRGNEDVMYRVE